MTYRIIVAAVAAVLLCAADGAAGDAFPGKTWQVSANPGDLGWSPAKLARVRDFSERIGSAAVVIVDDGTVVAQWGHVAVPFKLHSIRKPLTSALIGIQVAEGTIDLSASMAELDIDDNPPSLSETEKTATVGDLLAARSGIYHPALGEAPVMKAARPERHSHAPGSFYYYNNWDFNVLGAIFERAAGTSVCADFHRRIAGPLDMQDFSVDGCWYASGSESEHRYYGIRMSARDLARFGLLYLRGGRWRDAQVVPSQWVGESTRPHSSLGSGRGYGYMWGTAEGVTWLTDAGLPGRSFGHSGLGVHFLQVVPYRNLVVVHRVDTDVPGPYPDPFTFRTLMWLILDAAGEPDLGEEPSFEAARGTRVTGFNAAEVFGQPPVVLEGTRPNGLVEGGDRDFTARFLDGGVVHIESGGRRVDAGKWWFHGARFCFRLDRMTGGRTEFRYPVVDGNRVKFYDPATGSLAFTLFRPGE